MKAISIPVNFEYVSQDPVQGCENMQGFLIGETESPEEVFIIHAAMAVPKEVYLKFSQWLAEERNANVIIYDYSGFAHSWKGHIKDSPSSMYDWTLRDQSSVLDYVIEKYPNSKINIIGHSAGGIMLQYHKNVHKVHNAIAIASGQGYWLRHSLHYVLKAFLFWWIAGPMVVKTLEYLPGKVFGLGKNLPSKAYWQWRRWCLKKQFYLGEKGLNLEKYLNKNANFMLTFVGIEDDPIITPKMAEEMQNFYKNSKIQTRYAEVKLAEHGVKNIGHIGFFKSQNKKAWPFILKFLD